VHVSQDLVTQIGVERRGRKEREGGEEREGEKRGRGTERGTTGAGKWTGTEDGDEGEAPTVEIA